MEEINLSRITDDKFAVSFLLSLCAMNFAELRPPYGSEAKLVERYIGDYTNDFRRFFAPNCFDNFVFTSDSLIKRRARIDEQIRDSCIIKWEDMQRIIDELIVEKNKLTLENLFNSSPYNLCFLIYAIDDYIYKDMDVILANSIGSYMDGVSMLRELQEKLLLIHLGISSFTINLDQDEDKFDWSKHYNVASNMHLLVANHIKTQLYKCNLISNNPVELCFGECYLSDIILLIDLFRIRRQLIVEKLMIALLFMGRSPEYDELANQCAKSLIELLSEIMFCGEIHKIYVQKGYFDTYSDKEMTSKDYTTRLSIIFSANNDDFYLLRIDMPHKGEEQIHINMEEIANHKNVAVGYPLKLDELEESIICDRELFNELFFVLNDRIWFRSQFARLLKHSQADNNQKIYLEELFHRQSHKVMCRSMESKEIAIAFVDELKKIIDRLHISSVEHLAFGKEDIPYESEITRMRNLYELRGYIIKKYIHRGDRRIIIKDMIEAIGICIDVDLESNGEIRSLVELEEELEKVFAV